MRLLVTSSFRLRQLRQKVHGFEQAVKELGRESARALFEHQTQRARILVDLCLQLELEQ
jgi:hypothetical protein